jgi:hypothetical protein
MTKTLGLLVQNPAPRLLAPTDCRGPRNLLVYYPRIPNGETPKMATWRTGNASKRTHADDCNL